MVIEDVDRDLIEPLLELKHKQSRKDTEQFSDLIEPLLELKPSATAVVNPLRSRLNRTTFGIETRLQQERKELAELT